MHLILPSIHKSLTLLQQHKIHKLKKNVNVWASKYDLQSYVPKLISSGYNNLLKLAKLTESELEKMGISQIGARKKILSATNEIKKKIDKLIKEGFPESNISKIAYLPESASNSTSENTSIDTKNRFNEAHLTSGLSLAYGDVSITIVNNTKDNYTVSVFSTPPTASSLPWISSPMGSQGALEFIYPSANEAAVGGYIGTDGKIGTGAKGDPYYRSNKLPAKFGDIFSVTQSAADQVPVIALNSTQSGPNISITMDRIFNPLDAIIYKNNRPFIVLEKMSLKETVAFHFPPTIYVAVSKNTSTIEAITFQEVKCDSASNITVTFQYDPNGNPIFIVK